MTANKIVEIMARAFVESIEKNPDDIVQDGLRRWEAWAPHIRDQLAELRDAGLAVVQGPYIQVTDHGEGSYTMKATVPEGYALVPVELIADMATRLESAADDVPPNGKGWEWRIQTLALCGQARATISAAQEGQEDG